MNLDDFIITVFCVIDDTLKEILRERRITRLRSRGPMPKLSDSETIAMEVVGEYLSLNTDKAIFDYFRRHCAHFFPAVVRIDRTTFVRQAANLCEVKEALWRRIVGRIAHDPRLNLVASFPSPVCRFGRAPRCRRFIGESAFGYDGVAHHAFYGFRFHALVARPGVIVSFGVAAANVHENDMVAGLTEGRGGILLGDRNYWNPRLREELAAKGVDLQAPFKPVQEGIERPLARQGRCDQPLALSHRDRVRPTGRTISDQEGMGQGYAASERQTAAEGFEPHSGFHAESAPRQPSLANIHAGKLN